MYTFVELQKKDIKTLNQELETGRKDLLAARLSVKMKQSKKSDAITKNKKYVAQTLTQLNKLNKEAQADKKSSNSHAATAK
jgi:ribosomal protein L29